MFPLIFYDIMNYNYPDNKEYFKINPDLTEGITTKPIKTKKLSNNIKPYQDFIKKYQKIFRYLPFIKAVYVSNSVSFKSVHKDSDIDLLIITENNKLYIGRLISKIILKLLKIEGKHSRLKFCTGFWITENTTDLYPLTIKPVDIYLAYWISHLQPIYGEDKEIINKIYKENLWVKEIIPAYNQKPQQIINITPIFGKSLIKKYLEKVLKFDFLNNLIKVIRKRIMIKNKKKFGKNGKDIIISDNILKFFSPDIRKLIYIKYKVLKPHFLHKPQLNKNWNIKKTTDIYKKGLFE